MEPVQAEGSQACSLGFSFLFPFPGKKRWVAFANFWPWGFLGWMLASEILIEGSGAP